MNGSYFTTGKELAQRLREIADQVEAAPDDLADTRMTVDFQVSGHSAARPADRIATIDALAAAFGTVATTRELSGGDWHRSIDAAGGALGAVRNVSVFGQVPAPVGPTRRAELLAELAELDAQLAPAYTCPDCGEPKADNCEHYRGFADEIAALDPADDIVMGTQDGVGEDLDYGLRALVRETDLARSLAVEADPLMVEPVRAIPEPGGEHNAYSAANALIDGFGLPRYKRMRTNDETVTLGLPDGLAVDAWSAALGWVDRHEGQWGSRRLTLIVACAVDLCFEAQASQLSGYCEGHHRTLWAGADNVLAGSAAQWLADTREATASATVADETCIWLGGCDRRARYGDSGLCRRHDLDAGFGAKGYRAMVAASQRVAVPEPIAATAAQIVAAITASSPEAAADMAAATKEFLASAHDHPGRDGRPCYCSNPERGAALAAFSSLPANDPWYVAPEREAEILAFLNDSIAPLNEEIEALPEFAEVIERSRISIKAFVIRSGTEYRYSKAASAWVSTSMGQAISGEPTAVAS